MKTFLAVLVLGLGWGLAWSTTQIGPSTLANLPGVVDTNNALTVYARTYDGTTTIGPSAIANLPGRVDANGALAVAFANGSLLVGANGQSINLKQATTTVTCSSGATCTATNLIPAGSLVLGVDSRVTTAITGPTTIDIGDGTTANLFGDDEALTLGSTTTLADHASTFATKLYKTATSVVLTANGSNFSAGVVRLTIHYLSLTAATS